MGSGQEKSPDYFPFKLDQEGGDANRYAFLVSGIDGKRTPAQAQVLGLFLKHRARIISHWGYQESGNEFVLCLNCDMSSADITPDGLLLELRLLKSVQNARSTQMETRLFDGFSFPPTLLDNRALVLDSQFTFLIEHELKTPELKQALVEAGRIYALDIVRQIREKIPPDGVLSDNVLDYFKAAGFGRFSVLDDERSTQVIIRDPPLSQRGEASGNHFVHGIVTGLVEVLHGRETTVIEDLYDPKTCRLFIALLDRKNASSQVKARALEEVEKVISSIESEEKPKVPIPALAVNSSATLNQVLRTFESEGWVGGKIGYVPEREKSNQIVVKYYDKVAALPLQNGAETSAKPVLQTPAEKPQKKQKVDEEERDFASALKSALGEDDVYFEQSDFLG